MNHNKAHDMNKKDDIRNLGDGMEEQGSTQALPKLYPSFTQGLGLLKSMARVWLEYAYSMSRVCLKYAYATPMLRRCYADGTPMLRRCYSDATPMVHLQYAKSMSGVCQELVSCERPVRPARTLSPSRANTQSASFGQLFRFTLLFVVMMLGSVGAWGQDYYVITYNNNVLAHTNATTLGNVTGNNFNINTCLWTIYGNNIIAIAPDGTMGNYLRFESNGYYGLSLSDNESYSTWNNASDGGYPQSTSGNYYIRYNNEWTLSDRTTYRGTLHQVTVTSNTTTGSTPTSETYAASINGNSVIYSTGVQNYSPEITHASTYPTTTTKTFSVSINGTNRSGNSQTNGTTTTTETYTGALTNINWSVSPNTYGTINASTGELTINSLPTLVDEITINLTAQAAGQTVTASMTVTLAKDESTVENQVGHPSGTSSTTVTLNDYEDHSWSYYSDPDCPIHSLNPANVKITYYGDGIMMTGTTDYTSEANTGWIREDNNNYVGNAKVNVGGENENTFIYYKTLERENADGSGRCPYKSIPNPFQVRPTYGTPPTSNRANWTGWRGFQCWRLKSVTGGSVYTSSSSATALSVGAVINAETEIYFAPSSEYGMSVDLEAVWSIAYIVYANGNGNWSVPNHAGLGYERNFVVLSSAKDFFFGGGGGDNNANIVDVNRPSTITPYLPNGTSGNNQIGNVQGVYANNANNRPITLQANTKFENVKFVRMGNNTLTANNHDLIIGRGCSGTVNEIFGLNGSSSSAVNYTIRLESGSYNGFHLSGEVTNTYITHSSTFSAKAVFGCDYDRAKTTNTKLYITGDIYGGQGLRFSSNTNRNNLTFDWDIKSGTIHDGILGDAEGGTESIYMGSSHYDSADHDLLYFGRRRLTMEGGNVASIAGGVDDTNNSEAGVNDNGYTVLIRIKKGIIRGSVYGAAAYSGASGDRLFVLTGGTVGGWIAGGANGTQTDGGKLSGKTSIYFGGNAKCSSNGSNTTIGPGNATGGNIFGAGSGNASAGNDATVGEVDQSTVVVADNAEVERNVYGGGNYGYVAGNGTANKSEMYIIGGTVKGNVFGGANMQKGNIVNYTVKGGTVKGGVYGGSNARGNLSGGVTMNISGGNIEGGVYGGGFGTNTVSCDVSGTVGITMTGGTVLTGLYGGGNVNSKINGKTTVNVNGGTVGASDSRASVYGGGLGAATRAKGIVEVNIGSIDNNNVTSGNAVIWGDVYGGSAKGVTNCNDAGTAFATGTKTDVTLNAGTLNGSLYGGGHGIEGAEANVWGPVTVVVNGGSVKDPDGANGNPGSVFGCNNVNGSPKSTVTVTVNGTDAHVPATYYQEGETLPDGKKVGDEKTPAVYAINGVYGGGNEADYTYTPANNTNSPTVTINECESSIKDVYGGGNAAAVPQTYVTINGGKIGRVFGGGNGERGENYPAHVGRYTATNTAYGTGNTNVFIKGGTIGQVFGGSNSNGEIKGNIKVDVETNNVCDMAVGEVYGGGNKAPSNVGSVTIGCMGDNDIIDYVYGGSNDADITGNVNLIIKGGRIKNVFGGNNTGHSISGSIAVTVDWSQGSCSNNYLGNVFGGGNLASIGTEQSPKAPTVKINHGTVTYNVYGGGKGASAVVTGNPVVTIGDTNADHYAIVGGDVYGGGDAAAVTGNSTVTYNDNNASSTVGNLFGGGNAAGVSGTSTVTLTSGKVTNGVYGGCNAEGSVGVVTIALNGGQVGTDANHTADVYGGGLGANTTTTGNIDVNLNGTTVYGDLYGGSALGSVNADGASPANLTKLTIGSNSLHGTIYGGGKGSNEGSGTTATSNGNVQIDYNTGNTSLTGLYGGANVNGLVKGNITVNVNANVGGESNSVNVFGGGLGQNTNTNGNVTVNVGTSDGTKAPVIYGDVYGGSALGNVNSGTEDYTHVNLNAGTIYGDAYGGGLGDANNAALVNGNVKVTQNGVAFVRATTTDDESNTVVTAGRIFGCNNLNGSPKGTVLVLVTKTTPETPPASGEHTKGIYDMAAVYGGGNLAAYDPATATLTATGQYTTNHTATGKPVQVVINGCTAVSIEYVYGGGNAAATPATDVVVLGAFELGNVFGGGNGKDKISYDNGANWTANPGADVGIVNSRNYGTGESLVTITGGTIHKAFGGSNTLGNVRTSATVNLDEAGSCPLEIDEVYGGGNEAYMAGGGNIILGCITYLKEIYGGARNADVGSNVSLTITSGHFDRVFGGNNQGGKIKGSIKVNIEETGCNPITIGELYGCGNAAAYSVHDKENGRSADPELNIKSFTSIGRVFGGGLGASATVTGNPTVNIDEVFGKNASETSSYAGTTRPLPGGSTVTLPTHTSGKIGAIGTVFGGGNAAPVIGNTNVNIGTQESVTYVSGDKSTNPVEGVDIREDVFGGGLGSTATVSGNTNVKIGR